jgi:hypothetical protein
MTYGLLLIHWPSWRPDDPKAMTARERRYWLELGEYISERRKSAT